MVFKTIAIFMTSLHPWRAGANKGEQDKAMDIPRSLKIVLLKRNKKIPTSKILFFYDRGRYLTSSIFALVRPDSPVIRNFIAGEPRNVFPLLYVWIKLVVTHGQGLLNRLRLWGEPLSLLAQGCGSFLLYSIPDLMQLQNDTGPLAPVAWVA